MSVKIVERYATLSYPDGTTRINLYFTDGTESAYVGLDQTRARLILDILRNEKPLYWTTEHEILWTGREPVGEQEQPPDLHAWLSAHLAVCNAIVWETPSGSKAYPDWSAAQKVALLDAFRAAWYYGSIPLTDPPPNMVHPSDDEHATTVLAETHAWPLYLAYVGQSLAVETGNWVPWSLTSYSSESLALLLDSREMFHWNAGYGGYQIEQSKGRVTPAPPDLTYAFLYMNDMIVHNRLLTIGRVLDWCRQNMVHFTGGAEAKNMEDQWQYRGYPPVSRIIAGTPFTGHPERGIQHRTAGCRGTTGFLRAILRVVNIPVEQVHACGHAMPHFVAEDRYLSHGDDPYNALSKATPPFPAEELMIDQAKYNAWFGSGVSNDERCDNVGRRTRELAIEYLPNYVLHAHCSDIAAGRPHSTSDVYDIFKRNYSLAELEAVNLWTRMDDKIASFGGCDHVP